MTDYYVFDVKSRKNDRRHIFMYHGRRISQYFMGYWGRFAHTGNPNGARGALSRSNLTEVSFPEWPRYRESQHNATLLRMRNPPVAGVAADDIEGTVSRRCGWWRDTQANRGMEKPWQVKRFNELGLRCCCDGQGHCARSKDRSCPTLDFGEGEVNTVQDEFGCWDGPRSRVGVPESVN